MLVCKHGIIYMVYWQTMIGECGGVSGCVGALHSMRDVLFNLAWKYT